MKQPSESKSSSGQDSGVMNRTMVSCKEHLWQLESRLCWQAGLCQFIQSPWLPAQTDEALSGAEELGGLGCYLGWEEISTYPKETFKHLTCTVYSTGHAAWLCWHKLGMGCCHLGNYHGMWEHEEEAGLVDMFCWHNPPMGLCHKSVWTSVILWELLKKQFDWLISTPGNSIHKYVVQHFLSPKMHLLWRTVNLIQETVGRALNPYSTSSFIPMFFSPYLYNVGKEGLYIFLY